MSQKTELKCHNIRNIINSNKIGDILRSVFFFNTVVLPMIFYYCISTPKILLCKVKTSPPGYH